MKKVISSFFLLIIILATFSYSVLYISFNLISQDNLINNIYRKKFLANYPLRKSFKLHRIGDARFDYATDKKFSKLKIIVYCQKGEALSPETIQQITQEIKNVVEKPKGIVAEKGNLEEPINNAVTDKELSQLAKLYPAEWSTSDKTATVQIFVLKKYAPVPTFAGLVKDADNIFLFMDAIRDVSDEQRSTQNAQTSTVLHEFGHLLGAEHVDDESCIMSERVENLTYGFPSVISTTYCYLDLEEIKSALAY